jgi:hypothetical protein
VADDADACPEACTGSSFEGHAYVFCLEPGANNATRTWQWAMNFCEDRDQTLVVIETEGENEFIYERLDAMDGGDAWIAATDQPDEDVWVWAIGEDSDSWQAFYDADEGEPIGDGFIDWSDGEPDNTPGTTGADCGVLEALGDGEYGWADRACGANYDLVVCEDVD